MNKKSNITTYIIAILSMIISFVLVIMAKGLENLTIDGSLEIKKIISESIHSVSFWILNTTIAIATVLVWFWSFVIKKTKRLSEKEYTDKLELFNTCLKSKGNDFIAYIKEENKRRRIAAFVEHIEHKIMAQEKKLARLTSVGLHIKRDVCIQKKIDRYKSRITPEYLNQHLVWWWYNSVSPSDFKYNCINAGDVGDRTNSREGIRVSMTMTTKIIFSLAVSTIALSFLTSLLIEFKLSPSFWMILSSVVLSLSMNFYWGMKYADKIYESEYLSVLDNRIIVMKDYINWSKKKGSQEETFADKAIAAYNNNKELSEKLAEQIKQAEVLQKKIK